MKLFNKWLLPSKNDFHYLTNDFHYLTHGQKYSKMENVFKSV